MSAEALCWCGGSIIGIVLAAVRYRCYKRRWDLPPLAEEDILFREKWLDFGTSAGQGRSRNLSVEVTAEEIRIRPLFFFDWWADLCLPNPIIYKRDVIEIQKAKDYRKGGMIVITYRPAEGEIRTVSLSGSRQARRLNWALETGRPLD